MERNDKNEAPLKKLASAQDLRGSKSGTGPEGKGQKRKLLLPILAAVVVLGLAVGAYFAAQNMIPAEDPNAEPTAAPYTNETVKLIADSRSNVASVTVALADGETYTILNNNKYNEDGSALIWLRAKRVTPSRTWRPSTSTRPRRIPSSATRPT